MTYLFKCLISKSLFGDSDEGRVWNLGYEVSNRSADKVSRWIKSIRLEGLDRRRDDEEHYLGVFSQKASNVGFDGIVFSN